MMRTRALVVSVAVTLFALPLTAAPAPQVQRPGTVMVRSKTPSR